MLAMMASMARTVGRRVGDVVLACRSGDEGVGAQRGGGMVWYFVGVIGAH